VSDRLSLTFSSVDTFCMETAFYLISIDQTIGHFVADNSGFEELKMSLCFM